MVERDENQALDKNECQVDPPANSPKTTTIMQSTAVMETAKDFTENANTADTKTVELVQVEAKDEQESIPVTNNRKRAVKRKNTDSEPLSKESNDAVEVGDQSSKRKRKPSPVEKAVVEECEVVESVTKRKPGVSARKGAKGKETTVSPEPTIASTDTPKKAKQSEEDSDGDTETFKKPLKSALKSKRSKEVDETPSSSKKISFSKKEPKSFSDASAKEPEKSSIKNGKDIVLLSSNINEEQLKLLKKFEKKFGCRLVNEYDDLVTHFVTTVDEENLGARTLKYLMALMGHKYLLGFDWVAESLKSGSLQPEETFEMLGTKKQAKETYGAPKVSRTTQPKMFKGFTFYLDGKFATAGFPNKENFKQLVELGGGTVITTPAQLKAGLKDNLEKLHFIIDPNNQRSKFLAHPNHVQGSDLLNKIMELRFE